MLDRPIDFDRFRSRIAYGAAMVPRLRDRVVSGLGRLSPPEWAPDPEFDLDYHVRHIALPEPGSQRQLLDLAAQLYQDPYDRSRPLWYFVLIDGLEGGRGALFAKLHHSLADGIAGLRLSELYVDRAVTNPTRRRSTSTPWSRRRLPTCRRRRPTPS